MVRLARSHTVSQLCSAKLYDGFACAGMPMSGCKCFVVVVLADIVGFGAGTDPQERSFSVLPWTMRASILEFRRGAQTG